MGLAEKLLADGERPLVVLRPHARRLVRPALILLVLAPAAAFAAGMVPPGVARAPARFVVATLALLVAARWVLWPFLRWWNTLYVLTDERFFERAGLVRRTGHDLPLQGVTDVVVAQSLGERLLRCGTLRVLTEGGGEIAVTDVPGITRVQGTLLSVVDDIHDRLRSVRADAGTDPDDQWDDRWDDAVDDPWDDAADEGWDDPAKERAVGAPAPPDRSEARRRERESRRRLKEIQAQARRMPLHDSPLEDDGGDERPDARAAAPGPPPEADDAAGGARILRFPPRS